MTRAKRQGGSQASNDAIIAQLVADGRVRVDFETGLVYATKSNDPNKPVGSPTKKGYLRATMNVGGRSDALMAQRIIWIAAHGLPDSSTPQINHKDTIKTHNWLSNLELQTNAGNMQHAAAHGCLRPPRGERAHRAKLTRDQVRSIRAERAKGASIRSLAR